MLFPNLPRRRGEFVAAVEKLGQTLIAAKDRIPTTEPPAGGTLAGYPSLSEVILRLAEWVARWLEAFDKPGFWEPGKWDWSYHLPRSIRQYLRQCSSDLALAIERYEQALQLGRRADALTAQADFSGQERPAEPKHRCRAEA